MTLFPLSRPFPIYSAVLWSLLQVPCDFVRKWLGTLWAPRSSFRFWMCLPLVTSPASPHKSTVDCHPHVNVNAAVSLPAISILSPLTPPACPWSLDPVKCVSSIVQVRSPFSPPHFSLSDPPLLSSAFPNFEDLPVRAALQGKHQNIENAKRRGLDSHMMYMPFLRGRVGGPHEISSDGWGVSHWFAKLGEKDTYRCVTERFDTLTPIHAPETTDADPVGIPDVPGASSR